MFKQTSGGAQRNALQIRGSTPKLALLAYKREAPPPSRGGTHSRISHARTHSLPSKSLKPSASTSSSILAGAPPSIFIAGDFVKLSARDIDTTGHFVKHFLTVDLAVNDMAAHAHGEILYFI